ncbi:TniQ family protein [Ketogulonicigenium robustum]|uniref:TniQ family protein n=1 Tax=Ketogulonicigenium robustum TaxID=92947 RepID=UPI0018DC2BE1|nr:TniQ family protein [Ketogulonicigenium robustum]
MPIQVGTAETAASALGRGARANGYAHLQDICSDQGISLRELANGQPHEVKHAAVLIGADADVLLFNTPRLQDDGRFELGRENIKFTALTRTGGQVCLVCMLEARAQGQEAWQCGRWQVRHIRTCAQHGVLLEAISLNTTSKNAQDFGAYFAPRAHIQAQKVESQDQELELYLDGRIEHGTGESWPDSFEFHVVAVFCEALGALLAYGPKRNMKSLSPIEIVKAGSVGFKLFQKGPDALLSRLKSIQTASMDDGADYGKLYPQILTCLRERRKDPCFDGLRTLVREFILDNFHVPPNSSILGEVNGRSRVMTVAIGAREGGVANSLLNRQLKLMGFLRDKVSDNTISDRGLLISTAVIDEAVSVVKKLSTIAVTRAALGADKYTIERLCAEGVLKLHFPADDGCMPFFHEREILRLSADLRAATTCNVVLTDDHVSLQEAARRSHCTLTSLIGRAVAGTLKLASPCAVPFRLPDFLVSLSELRVQIGAVPPEVLTAAEAARLLGVIPGTIHALVAAEYLPGTFSDYRLANRACLFILHADLEHFANAHIVLRALSGTRKATFEATQEYIAECGVEALVLAHESRKIFRRSDIERIAYDPGGERLARLLMVDEARLEHLFQK